MRNNFLKIIKKILLVFFVLKHCEEPTYGADACMIPLAPVAGNHSVVPRKIGGLLSTPKKPLIFCPEMSALGIGHKTQCEVWLLSQVLYKENRDPELPPPSKKAKFSEEKSGWKYTHHLSPTKVQQFTDLGGREEDLDSSCARLKKEHATPIKDTVQYSPTKVYVPIARAVGLSRHTIKEGISRNIFRELEPLAFVLPDEPPETETERLERHKREEEAFQEAEHKRGVIPEDLDKELQDELKIWKTYFSYMENRKNQPPKLRRSGIEDAFHKYVASQMESLQIGLYLVYFLRSTLDLHRENDYGETNQELMAEGKCPIGADGELMNYHHLTHHDSATHGLSSCIIVLITNTLHTKYSGVLHFGKSQYHLPPNKVDRGLFTPERMKFNKAIAQFVCDNP